MRANPILTRFSPLPVGMNAISPAFTWARKVFVEMVRSWAAWSGVRRSVDISPIAALLLQSVAAGGQRIPET